MWLCNLCTFATRPIKVLFSYFNISSPCVFIRLPVRVALCDALSFGNANEAKIESVQDESHVH